MGHRLGFVASDAPSRGWTAARPSCCLIRPSRCLGRPVHEVVDGAACRVTPRGTAKVSAALSRRWTAACPSVASAAPSRRWTARLRVEAGIHTVPCQGTRRRPLSPHPGGGWMRAPPLPLSPRPGGGQRGCAPRRDYAPFNPKGHGDGLCCPSQEVDGNVSLPPLPPPLQRGTSSRRRPRAPAHSGRPAAGLNTKVVVRLVVGPLCWHNDPEPGRLCLCHTQAHDALRRWALGQPRY